MKSLRGLYEDNPYIIGNKDKPFTDEKIEEAIKWCEENDGYIVLPCIHDDEDKTEPYTIEHIEYEWIKYEQLQHKLRRMSDWKALELFDMDNKALFEFLREIFSVKDIDKNSMEEDKEFQMEAVIDMSDQVDYNRINYGFEEIKAAKEWSNINGLTIIIPCNSLEELEKQWENFNYMLQKHRRISDCESEKIFGVNNQKHYIWLKKHLLNKDIDNITMDDIDTVIDSEYITPDNFISMENYIKKTIKVTSILSLTESIVDYMNQKNESTYNNIMNQKMLKNIAEYEELVNRVDMDFIPSSDLPYYTPDEMIDMGVFNHVETDNYYNTIADNNELADGISTQSWFEEYRYHFNGFDTPNRKKLYVLRTHKLNELCTQLDIMKKKECNTDEICAKKQSILELGWNPDIKYTPENRAKVNKFYLERCNAHISTQIVDMRDLHFYNEEKKQIKEDNELKPIFIVLTSGKNIRSQFIKLGTMSQYSHCLIGFDPSLKRMYSYDTDGGSDGKGGFKVDSIKNYDTDQKINVFCIFVKENDYNIIKNNIEHIKKSMDDTSYSYRNILAFLFHPIPADTNNMNQICSQFVDRMLKSVGVDLTNKKSQHVSPAEFKRQSKKNNKIYNVFEDKQGNFKPEYIHRSVETLMSRDANISIKEFATLLNRMKYLNESDYNIIYNTFLEAYINIEPFEYENIVKESHMSFSYLDKVIRCFGKLY